MEGLFEIRAGSGDLPWVLSEKMCIAGRCGWINLDDWREIYGKKKGEFQEWLDWKSERQEYQLQLLGNWVMGL